MTRSIAARSAKGLLLAGVAGVAISACANENSQAAAEQSAAEASEVAAADANIKDANMDAGHEGMHAPGAPAFGSRPVVAEYVDNFRLVDHTGLSHELFYHADASAVVIMTQGNGCPIVRNAVPEYRRLKEKFADAGIEFYLMNSNLQDNRDEIAAEAEEYEFGIPVLVDNNQIIGESMGVHRTAEVFVIDPNEGFKVVYHGPLDDRLTYERQKAEPEERYLDDVLTAIVAGNDITTEAPPVTSGCLINFPERA
ncbi:MAG: redoxin domain-containing protein, partial [Pseudomonadota bacterium]